MNAHDWLTTLMPEPSWLFLIIAVIALIESLAVIGLAVPGVVLITAAASLAGHLRLNRLIVLAIKACRSAILLANRVSVRWIL